MAGVPKIVVFNYTTLPSKDFPVQQLQQKISALAGPVTVDLNVVHRCDGWAKVTEIPQKWPDCCGLVLTDSVWDWSGCGPRPPDHPPIARLGARSKTVAGYALAGYDLPDFTLVDPTKWINSAAEAIAPVLNSASPAELARPRSGYRPVIACLGRHLAVLASLISSLVRFVLRSLGHRPKMDQPPLEWGP